MGCQKSPLLWQQDAFYALEKMSFELEKKPDLVGVMPGLVFDSDLFGDAINTGLTGASPAAEDISDTKRYKVLPGSYSPFIAKHLA